MSDELVKVRVRLKPDEEDEGPLESLWAKPLDAHEGGGTFRLENNSFMAPLAVGDVVRAELDGDGVLQVTALVESGGGVLTLFAPADWDGVEAMLERWSEAGATWSEGGMGVLSTIWEPTVSLDTVMGIVLGEIEAGSGQLITAVTAEERVAEAQEEIDFELDTVRHLPEVTTDYWAADDPWWREHGLDDPEFLAFVQRLAGEDARVARALERGQQDRVVTYVERITTPDPSTLPPLDGPLFEDP